MESSDSVSSRDYISLQCEHGSICRECLVLYCIYVYHHILFYVMSRDFGLLVFISNPFYVMLGVFSLSVFISSPFYIMLGDFSLSVFISNLFSVMLGDFGLSVFISNLYYIMLGDFSLSVFISNPVSYGHVTGLLRYLLCHWYLILII